MILGATPNESCIVERARELGVYTIVTDYNTDHSISPAKDLADEFWDVSWSDTDTLEVLCREKKIDGVIAGFSEIRVDNLIKLCDRLGLPCYAKDDQLEITRNKHIFKSQCRKFGIPVINEYASPDDVSSYPVIVKPVDRAGSIGVGIAYNRAELDSAYAYAMEMSLKKHVIIEDYITDCSELDVHYGIINGEIFLLSSDDVIHAENNETERKVIQSGWFCPERHYNSFLNEADTQIRNLIKDLGIMNGTIFFSGFVDDNGRHRFFECGFRMWGPQEYNYTRMATGINYLDIYLYYALLGSAESLKISEQRNEKLKYAALWVYAKEGTIARIEGFEKVKEHKLCTQAILYCRIGEECTEDKAILSRLALFEFASEDPEKLKEAVDYAYAHFKVSDESGNDMLYDRINSSKLLTWWN